MKELYKIANAKSKDSDPSDSDQSVGSNTRREYYKSDSSNDIDYIIEKNKESEKIDA